MRFQTFFRVNSFNLFFNRFGFVPYSSRKRLKKKKISIEYQSETIEISIGKDWFLEDWKINRRKIENSNHSTEYSVKNDLSLIRDGKSLKIQSFWLNIQSDNLIVGLLYLSSPPYNRTFTFSVTLTSCSHNKLWITIQKRNCCLTRK